jgi:exodeoxyribonuclease VII large subunit
MHANRTPINQSRHTLERLAGRLGARRPDTRAVRTHLAALQHRCAVDMAARAGRERKALGALAAQLELLNPQRTLERGYAILSDSKGAILRSPAQLQPRRKLRVRLADGSADITVSGVQPTL